MGGKQWATMMRLAVLKGKKLSGGYENVSEAHLCGGAVCVVCHDLFISGKRI
jgi:hypothetical protein